MKLIDILVDAGDETPLFGVHTKYLAMDPDGRVHGYCEMPSPTVLGWGIPDALYSTDGRGCLIQIDRDDVDGQWQSAIITREQYEAALAEKEHPLPWDEKNKPCPTLGAECRGCPDCGRRVSCTSDDITDDAVRAEMGMNSRTLDSALAAKNDGWIEWGGGKHPPVSTNTVVDVKLEKGYVQSGYPAGEYSWEHIWQGSNIIAYRLHKPNEAERVRASAWSAYAGITEADDEADLNECIGQDAAPVWNGEGVIPPVGYVCERSWAGDEWLSCEILFASNQIVVVKLKESGIEDAYNIGDVTFRPIRSEAERKRDEAVAQLNNFVAMGKFALDKDLACAVYDAIAAGKIPGVKLDD